MKVNKIKKKNSFSKKKTLFLAFKYKVKMKRIITVD